MASVTVNSNIQTTNDSLNLNTCSATVSVSEKSYDVAGNYSVVTVSYSASITSNRTFTGTTRPNAGYLRIIVNGTQKDITMPFNSGAHLGSSICSGSYTQTVNHNADGSKTVGFSAQIVTGTDQRNYGVVWVTSSASSSSQALTTIPRASKPTVSSSTLTIGSTQVINTNRAADSFTHTIKVELGSYAVTMTSVGASVQWIADTATMMPYMSKYQQTVTVTCTTYSGSTQIGTAQTTTFTLKVDTAVYKPVITFGNAVDTNETTAALEKTSQFIKGYSNLSVLVSVRSNNTDYGDKVASLKVELGGASQSKSINATSGEMTFTANAITVAQLKATATDNRGYSVTATKSIALINYSAITIESVKVARVNQNGDSTETGEYIKYTIKGNAYLGSFGQQTNTIRVRTRSKLAKESSYGSWVTEQTVTTSGNGVAQFTITGITVGTYLSTTQYDVIFRLEDALSARQLSDSVRIHEGIPVYAWGETHFDVYGAFHIHDRDDVTKYITLDFNGGGLNGILRTQWFTSASVSCAANDAGSVSIPITVPDGYKFIGIIGVCSNGAVVPCYSNSSSITNGQVTVWWRNPTGSSMTCTFSVNVLLIRI